MDRLNPRASPLLLRAVPLLIRPSVSQNISVCFNMKITFPTNLSVNRAPPSFLLLRGWTGIPQVVFDHLYESTRAAEQSTVDGGPSHHSGDR